MINNKSWWSGVTS